MPEIITLLKNLTFQYRFIDRRISHLLLNQIVCNKRSLIVVKIYFFKFSNVKQNHLAFFCTLNISKQFSLCTGSQKEKYKSPSYQIREGDQVNTAVTAPGATLALGMMFFRSGNKYAVFIDLLFIFFNILLYCHVWLFSNFLNNMFS